MTSIHDAAGLDRLRAACRLDPDAVRRLRNAFYKKHRPADAALEEIPEPARATFREAVAFHTLELHSLHDSRLDGATKLLFRTARGHLLETVILRIGTGRTTLCISSQVGCAAKCAFCATGRMGLAANLSRDEILDQVVQANALLREEGRAVRNVVFMGMGEPFHNTDAVHAALDVLLSPRCFGLPAGRVIVSTVGIPDGLTRTAATFPGLGLAVSLHSARQEERERLIPLARRYPLDRLRAAIAEVARPVMIEYLMLDGRTDTDADLEALRAFLAGLAVHVNLIPFNAIDDADLRGSPPERVRAFADALTAAGFLTTVRYSLGADIAAACGQLARRAVE